MKLPLKVILRHLFCNQLQADKGLAYRHVILLALSHVHQFHVLQFHALQF